MRLLIVDNFDSFTYNLMHICEKYCERIDVIRADVLNLDEPKFYDKIIISPGPGLPSDFLIKIITKYKRNKSILGVCLGAQAISLAFNCKIYNMKKVMHGKQSSINLIEKHDEIYFGIKNNLKVGRYHSWAVDINKNSNLLVTSVDEIFFFLICVTISFNVRSVISVIIQLPSELQKNIRYFQVNF